MPYSQIILLIVTFIAISNAPLSGDHEFTAVFAFNVWFLKLLAWIIVCFFGAIFAKEFGSSFIDLLQWFIPLPLVIDIYFLQLHKYFVSIIPEFLVDIFVSYFFLLIYFLYLIIYWICYWFIMPFKPLISELMSRLLAILPGCVPFILFVTVDELVQYFLIKNTELPFDKIYIVYASYLLMIIVMVLLTPYVIRVMWQCEPLPQGELRRFVESTCKDLGVKFRDILLWHNPWGNICTAGVMGFLPGFRYILLTPCIIENLTPRELQAVLHHEIAHIKNHHLLWQAIIILSFVVMVSSIAKPLFFYLVSTRHGYTIYMKLTEAPEYIASFILIFPVIVIFLLYLRFFIGYFIRSFERDADVTALLYQGHPWYLISALEKVGFLSGISRNAPNWHHYSISQRIEFLRSCFVNPDLIRRFKSSLIWRRNGVILISFLITILGLLIPFDYIKERVDRRILDHVIGDLDLHKENAEMLLLLSQFFTEKKLYDKAYEALIIAQEKAPDHPDVLNNLAWFILTTEDKRFYDPKKALELAQKAYSLKSTPYIMDTLAEAYYANGDYEKAIYYGELALKNAEENIDHYKRQLEKFYEAAKTLSKKNG